MSPIARVASLSVAVVSLAGCGGGGGGGTPPPTTYTVGGTVTGLSGTGLVLQNNGGNNLPVAASGPFSFSTALAGGVSYAVTVLTQPSNPTQACVVTAGGGTVATSNVTTVAVTCTTSTYAVGGTVSGLSGTGLVLQNNGGNDLTVDADGAFAFSTLVASGAAYEVSIETQPTGGAPERCTVKNGSGTIGSAAVVDIEVTCAPPPGGFLYVPNQASNDVSAYAIDANTGTLTAVAGSPFPAAPSPTVASVSASGEFLYVSSRGSTTTPPVLSGYSIDAETGALTPLNGSPFALSVASAPANGRVQEIGKLLIHPSGLFGYLTIPFPTGRIYGLAINPMTGELTEVPGMPISLGHTLYTGTYASSGNIVYFPHISNGPPVGLVTGYSIDQPSGVLTPFGSFDIQSRGPTMAVLAPGDEFLLTPNYWFPNVSVMDVDPLNGTMAPVAGSPITLTPNTTMPFALVYHPGHFFYVTDSASPTIFGFRLNPATMAVTPVAGSPYTVGTGQVGPAVLDRMGRFLFVPQRTANAIQAYTIDQATGALTTVGTPVSTQSFPAVASDPSGRFLFVSNGLSHTVSSYSVNGTTGALTLNNTLPAGQSPQLAEVLVP